MHFIPQIENQDNYMTGSESNYTSQLPHGGYLKVLILIAHGDYFYGY